MAKTHSAKIEALQVKALVNHLALVLEEPIEDIYWLLGQDSNPSTYEDRVYTSHVVQIKGVRLFIDWGSTEEPAVREAMVEWYRHVVAHPLSRPESAENPQP